MKNDLKISSEWVCHCTVCGSQDSLPANDPSPPIINVPEAADFLRVSKATIYDMVHKRTVPFRKHGSRVVFSREELMDWSNRRKVETRE
jgi:excisionase family DNA binding protein